MLVWAVIPLIIIGIVVMGNSYAEESVNFLQPESDPIDVKLIVFENTSIVEFRNNGIEPIHSFKFWLVDDSFLSFKTEYGWIGKKNNQGELIFSSSIPFESVELQRLLQILQLIGTL